MEVIHGTGGLKLDKSLHYQHSFFLSRLLLNHVLWLLDCLGKSKCNENGFAILPLGQVGTIVH